MFLPSAEACNGPKAHPRINHKVKNSPSVALTWFHTNNGTIPHLFTSALVIFLPRFTSPGFKPFPEQKLPLTAAGNCFVRQRVSLCILCLLFNSRTFSKPFLQQKTTDDDDAASFRKSKGVC